MKTHKTQQGIALLVSIMVSTIVVSIGAALFSIVQKQVALSSLARDSQFAFYTADVGAECALYWDSRFQYFAASSTHPTITTTCDQNTFTTQWQSTVTYPYTATFQTQASGKCVAVTIQKTLDGRTPPGLHTGIRADGFNVPCSATTSSPTVLQRSVQLNY